MLLFDYSFIKIQRNNNNYLYNTSSLTFKNFRIIINVVKSLLQLNIGDENDFPPEVRDQFALLGASYFFCSTQIADTIISGKRWIGETPLNYFGFGLFYCSGKSFKPYFSITILSLILR